MTQKAPGACLVISGPSGSGKTTVVGHLVSCYVPGMARLVTTTTRAPRPGEQDGIDYHFTTREEFLAGIERGEFLEWAETYGELYGSSKVELEKLRGSKQAVFAIVDTKGARSYREKVPGAVLIMCLASLSELEFRLGKRPGMTPEKMRKRLAEAEQEMAFAGKCDYAVRCEGRLATTLMVFSGILEALLET